MLKFARPPLFVHSAVFAAVLCAGLPLATALAQFEDTPGVTQPEEPLRSRLEDLCKKLDERREALHIPGMAVAVVQGDKLILARGFGVRDVEKKFPVTEETLFCIGSATKAFTSCLTAMLVDEGKITFDEPVKTYWPQFTLADAEAANNAAMRDLLSHRTGLSRTDMVWYNGTASVEEILAAVGRAKPKDAFRKGWNYNNVMFVAAAEVMKRVSGKDWHTLIRERILTPLEMKASNTTATEALADVRTSKGYAWDAEKSEFKFVPMRVLTPVAPAGAINSNIVDMSRWVRFQLARGEAPIDGKPTALVKPATLEATWAKNIDLGAGAGYGMGWFIRDWNGKRVVEHGGNIDGYASSVAMLPDERVGFVLLMNVGASSLQAEALPLVWETFFPTPAPTAGAISPRQLEEYVGTYRFEQLNVDCAVQIKDAKLHIDVPGQTLYELRFPDDKGVWQFALTDQIKIRFERDDSKKITGATILQAGLEFKLPRKGVEQPVAKSPLTTEQLYGLTGNYRFGPTNTDWPMIVRKGRLVFNVPGQMPYVLNWPDEKGRWAFEVKSDIQVEFNKDEKGEAQSLTMFQSGMEFRMPRQPGTATKPPPSLAQVNAKRETAAQKFAALGAVRLTGTTTFENQGVSGPTTIWFEGSGKFSQTIDLSPFGLLRTAVVGEKAWSQSIGREFEEVHGDAARLARESVLSSIWTPFTAERGEIEVVGIEQLEDQQVVVVRCRAKDGTTSTVFVAADSGLTLREETVMVIPGAGSIPIKVDYKEFKPAGGATLPGKIVADSEAFGRMTMTIERNEINATPSADVFAPSK